MFREKSKEDTTLYEKTLKNYDKWPAWADISDLNARGYLHIENIIMLKDRRFSGELKKLRRLSAMQWS